MARDWLSRDRKLRKRKSFKTDNRKSVRNIERILEKKAKDIKEKYTENPWPSFDMKSR